MLQTFKTYLLVILLSLTSFTSFSQGESIEIVPSVVLPLGDFNEYYRPGYGFNGNYYFDDYQSYSLYSGIGFFHLRPEALEGAGFTNYTLSIYQGGQLNFQLNRNVLQIFLGGSVYTQMSFLIYHDPISGSSSFNIDYGVGLSPKTGLEWRINEGFIGVNAQIRYNIGISLDGVTFLQQFVQPAVGLKFFI